MRKQPTFAVARICNPFEQTCWTDIETPITREEIRSCIEHGNTAETPRAKHIRKIAEFVTNGWDDPIQIDIGIPSLGCNPDWPVTDGNHRLAAAIYKNDAEIAGEVSGAINHAESLGLNP